LIDQVTAGLLVPKTVAVNGCVPEAAKLTVDGLRDTVTAWRSVMTAVAIFEGSAMLVAVSVPLVVVGAVLGATYSAVVPPLTKPADAGVNDQVIPVLLVPPTVAVNFWFCDGSKDTEDGVSETVTRGMSVTVAVADFVGSATLVAFTVTVCAAAMVAGAV
jgi:hypothetical protein